jgi:hypothetical protein
LRKSSHQKRADKKNKRNKSTEEVQKVLLHVDSPVAMRQPKTDRLILKRLLREEALDMRLDEEEMKKAHDILVRWAELESSGRLSSFSEAQMQGDFLTQVFGDVLGYTGFLEGSENWHRIQHETVYGHQPDAILGIFKATDVKGKRKPSAIVELKGSCKHLDRDRSNGRTAVEQCWDYLVDMPSTCRWGITTNIVSFRLYERSSTRRAYEHFSLQSLRDFEKFKQFYVLFHRQGLIESITGPPRAATLLKQSTERQRQVSDELYETYSCNRTELISHLYFKEHHPLDVAIEMTQRLFDRIMFIAFCEDRNLLPKKTIPKAYDVAGFQAVTNPRWQNFKNLFQFIDVGNDKHNIPKYNGGLFASHAVDELELPDDPWANFFKSISSFDFSDEINLDVLGHLFERSITELEKLKESELFGGDIEKAYQYATMPQSAKKKQLGIYYTPPEITGKIVQYTIEELIIERFAVAAIDYGVSEKDAAKGVAPDDPNYWQKCLEILRKFKIVDPACGSGAFLFQAYNVLELRYHEVIGHLEQTGDKNAKKLYEQVPKFILQENLYGVDLSPEAVEITQLALWIRSATPRQTLSNLTENIVHGNSLVLDTEVHPAGFDWKNRFPKVFDRKESGFDCVIGNPPWERIKLQEKEFFAISAPEIATATNAAKRRKLVEQLKTKQPKLYQNYQKSLRSAESFLNYCHKSGEYPLTGKGDTNMYAVFAELASQLVAPHGRVGFLVPSGIASDKTTKDFFASVSETNRLIRLYDFENKKNFFPEVHASFKFCVINFGGEQVSAKEADFIFFVQQIEELEDSKRHIALTGDDIRLLNPNTRTCPIFRSQRDAEITKAIYNRIPVLIDENRRGNTGNPWQVEPKRKFDQDSKAEWFCEMDELIQMGGQWNGGFIDVKGTRYLPLYEAKMVQMYDHRAADTVTNASNWMRQGQKIYTTLVQHQNPEKLCKSRYWISEEHVKSEMKGYQNPFYIAFKKITAATNTRTMIASVIPESAPVDSLPFLHFSGQANWQRRLCLLSNLNSHIYDFVARNKVQGTHIQHYHISQFPSLPPEIYDKSCPWHSDETLDSWISERVLKLTCTAEDMLPLAEACDFTGGSFKSEYGGRLNKWDDQERAELMAELDSAFFHLYKINKDDVEYILSTFKGIHDEGSLFPEHCSMAKRIMEKYIEMS